jgi:hypothetical protein
VIGSQPYRIVQAYDRASIKEIPADDAGLEARLEAAFFGRRVVEQGLDQLFDTRLTIGRCGLI